MGVYANNSTIDAEKQRLIEIYRNLYLRQGMDPTLADRLANERAQRETFGGKYPKSPGDTLNDLTQEANLTNESRYAQLLDTNTAGKGEATGFLDSEANVMRGLAGSGLDVNLARNERAATTAKGNTAGSLYARGLGNSTVLDSFNTQIDDNLALQNMQAQANADQQRLGVEDSYTGRKLGVLVGSNRDREQIIQDRTDQPPNLGLYAQALSQAGAGGGFYVGGGAHTSHNGWGQIGGAGFGQLGSNFNWGAPTAPAYERPSQGANIYTGPYRTNFGGQQPGGPWPITTGQYSGGSSSGGYGAYGVPPGSAGPVLPGGAPTMYPRPGSPGAMGSDRFAPILRRRPLYARG